MTLIGHDYMTLDRQLFRRPLTSALAELLKQKYGTAKQLARAVGIDPATAENLRKGHLSVPTLEKALQAEGRDLWRRLGEEIFGETDLEYEARLIDIKIQEAEHARSNIERLRSRREALEQSAAQLDGVRHRQVAERGRRAVGEARAFDDGLGSEAPESLTRASKRAATHRTD
jgi:transcriptional regulator with XRE-family HTH domain